MNDAVVQENSVQTYAALSAEQVLRQLESNEQSGLSESEAQKRLKHYGPNAISQQKKSWIYFLLCQLKSPFILLFFMVAALLFVLQEVVNGIIIGMCVVINVGVGFYQEFKASKALDILNQYLVMSVVVRRAGAEVTIPSTQLVPGDIVILYPGEYVAADMRLIEVYGFSVDESVLTGESLPVLKTVEKQQGDITIFNAHNMVFAGTTAMSGKAVGVVVLTGSKSQMGTIAQLTATSHTQSSLEKTTIELGSFIVKFVVVTLLIIFAANLLFRTERPSLLEFTIFAVALALSAIPEALPVVVTFCLSRGVSRLSKLQVIVKRLSAIEELGSMQILCTDKTGTLTENSMTVVALNSVRGDDNELLLYAALASNHAESTRSIHTFDRAIWQKLDDTHKANFQKYQNVAEVPFDSVRLRNLTLAALGQDFELVVRGMPEKILDVSHHISAADETSLFGWIEQQGQAGNRILAIAKKKLAQQPHDLLVAEDEGAFDFLGLIAFADPLKQTAAGTIKKARTLGVAIKILSGDSKEVCGAVAFKAGLIGNVADVITGTEFAAQSFDQKKETIARYAVFARVLPEQKSEIIQMLQADQVTVGFIGDGINDAPALKAAHVSLAVSGAANVAREVADVLLLRTSLRVVIDGIEEGRKIVVNTLKYVRTTLAANFGNFYAVAIASLFVNYLPMKPTHLLLINMITDVPMIAIATDTVDADELGRPKKFTIRGMLLLAMILGLVSSTFDLVFFSVFNSLDPYLVQTAWFIESILTEIVFIFSIRSRKFFLHATRPSFTLIAFSLGAVLFSVLLPMTSFGQRWFGFVQLNSFHLLLILALVTVYLFVTDLVKLFYYKKFNAQP